MLRHSESLLTVLLLTDTLLNCHVQWLMSISNICKMKKKLVHFIIGNAPVVHLKVYKPRTVSSKTDAHAKKVCAAPRALLKFQGFAFSQTRLVVSPRCTRTSVCNLYMNKIWQQYWNLCHQFPLKARATVDKTQSGLTGCNGVSAAGDVFTQTA